VRPPRGFDHLVVSNRGVPLELPIGTLPQASTPLQSLIRQSWRPATLPLSRGFSPPQRYPYVESHTLPGLPPPGSRCVLALPLRLDAFLPRRTPRSVSTGRAHGVRPSELYLTGIARLSAEHPLLRLASGLLARARSNRVRHRRTSPRVAAFRVPCGMLHSLLSERSFDRATVSRIIDGPVCSFRVTALFRGGLASGGSSSSRLGRPPPDFSGAIGALALLGFLLPGAFPIPCLGMNRTELPPSFEGFCSGRLHDH